MKKYITSILSIGILILTGCDNEGKNFFEDERYIKQVYAVSDKNGMFRSEYELIDDKEFSTKNLSYAISGTNPIDKDVIIEIEERPELVDVYNKTTYMDEIDKYAWSLDKKYYNIPSTRVTIVTGANPNSEYGLFDIDIKNELLNQLSPDSVYLLGIGIQNTSPYPVIEEKRNVLYRIYKKNKYATQKKETIYTCNGYEGEGYFSGVQKKVFPLTSRATRFTVGNLVYASTDTEEQIKKKAMVVIVNDDNSVDITSYKQGLIIEKLSPSDDPLQASYYFRNEYNTEEKAFYLYYRYSTDGGNTFSKEIMEVLTRDTV